MAVTLHLSEDASDRGPESSQQSTHQLHLLLPVFSFSLVLFRKMEIRVKVRKCIKQREVPKYH